MSRIPETRNDGLRKEGNGATVHAIEFVCTGHHGSGTGELAASQQSDGHDGQLQQDAALRPLRQSVQSFEMVGNDSEHHQISQLLASYLSNSLSVAQLPLVRCYLLQTVGIRSICYSVSHFLPQLTQLKVLRLPTRFFFQLFVPDFIRNDGLKVLLLSLQVV